MQVRAHDVGNGTEYAVLSVREGVQAIHACMCCHAEHLMKLNHHQPGMAARGRVAQQTHSLWPTCLWLRERQEEKKEKREREGGCQWAKGRRIVVMNEIKEIQKKSKRKTTRKTGAVMG